MTQAGTASPATLPRIARAARESLGMDLGYVSRVSDQTQHLVSLDGDAASFGVTAGQQIPMPATACGAMLAGTLPNLVTDMRAHPVGRWLPVVDQAEVGAYLGVPLRDIGGRVTGTFCVISHQAEPHLGEREARFMRALAGPVAAGLERDAEHEEDARRVLATAAAVDALVAALAARDGYTGAHTRSVVRLALEVGSHLGLDDRELVELGEAARLHDVGKLGVPDTLLRKPGGLTDEETDAMRRHPEIGERIVAGLPTVAHLAPIVRAEHERWDGTGYPDGLAGEAIPLASRIVLACDAYDAMTSDRPYRRAMPAAEARAELRRHAGGQFCPRVIAALRVTVGDGDWER